MTKHTRLFVNRALRKTVPVLTAAALATLVVTDVAVALSLALGGLTAMAMLWHIASSVDSLLCARPSGVSSLALRAYVCRMLALGVVLSLTLLCSERAFAAALVGVALSNMSIRRSLIQEPAKELAR